MPLHDALLRWTRPRLLTFGAAVLLMMLIACTNVAVPCSPAVRCDALRLLSPAGARRRPRTDRPPVSYRRRAFVRHRRSSAWSSRGGASRSGRDDPSARRAANSRDRPDHSGCCWSRLESRSFPACCSDWRRRCRVQGEFNRSPANRCGTGRSPVGIGYAACSSRRKSHSRSCC